jgi:hypothetical protein
MPSITEQSSVNMHFTATPTTLSFDLETNSISGVFDVVASDGSLPSEKDADKAGDAWLHSLTNREKAFIFSKGNLDTEDCKTFLQLFPRSPVEMQGYCCY